MGIFDKLKRKSMTSIEDIIKTNYKQRFFKECRFIWKNYVPENGQAKCLQGELLREIEKIRCEAQDNGNINWDEDVDVNRLAYVEDNLYDIICDKIGQFQKENPSPILLKRNYDIKR